MKWGQAVTDTRLNPERQLTYAISYGFVGGPWHGRKLRKLLLRKLGLREADLKSADILIAHSAGCWGMPKEAKPKLVIYLGMPLAQNKPRLSFTKANANSLVHAPIRSLPVKTKSLFYSLVKPRHNLVIARSARTAKPVEFASAQSVFISNHWDPWTEDRSLENYLRSRGWVFLSLPGTHDDIWEHPNRYVELIAHYARLLV